MSATSPPLTDLGRRALACVDKALAARPKTDGHALTEATKYACEFRDGFIVPAEDGGEAERRRLEHANAVISAITAVHFPLGGTPWPQLQCARDWLDQLVEGEAG